MIVLGLTGSIAMGKSTAAAVFRRLGVPVFDADKAVHRLLGPGGRGVPAVGRAFPGVVPGNRVDHGALAHAVYNDADALSRLERILHPMVTQEQRRFLARHRREGRRLVVVDVPLLFETGGDAECDAVAVVSAPRFIQDQRLHRRGIGPERARAIRARQMPDAEKRARATFVIPTGLGRAVSERAIRAIVRQIRQEAPPRRSRSTSLVPPLP